MGVSAADFGPWPLAQCSYFLSARESHFHFHFSQANDLKMLTKKLLKIYLKILLVSVVCCSLSCVLCIICETFMFTHWESKFCNRLRNYFSKCGKLPYQLHISTTLTYFLKVCSYLRPSPRDFRDYAYLGPRIFFSRALSLITYETL